MIDREIGPPPSERTVARYLKEFKELPEEQQYLYREFRWPDAMVRDYLPWEASQFAVTLQMQMEREGAGPLTIERMRWHWRLYLALPALPVIVRARLVELYTYAEPDERGELPNLLELLDDYTVQ